MKHNSKKLKFIFIKRMILSAIFQIITIGFLIIISKQYLSHKELNFFLNDLIINDEFTLEEIGNYFLLENKYALDLELHNIGNMKKLDHITFAESVENITENLTCSIIKSSFSKICTENDTTYIGISTIKVENKAVGYVITKKNYTPTFSTSEKYDLALIIFTVIFAFIFNFIFLFLSLKKKIEHNTTRLVNILSLDNKIDEKIIHIDIEEYKFIAGKFSEEKKHIAALEAEKSYFQARKDIAVQVAHDINSPLAVIHMMQSNINFPCVKEKTLFNNALQKIRDITDKLIENYRNNTSSFLISEKISQIISQKHIEWNANPCTITFDSNTLSEQLYFNISLLEFDRMVSNLLNNAYEALENKRHININLFHHDNMLKLIISDLGSGIENEKISLILNGASFKHTGNGLGLSHAREFMAHCDGYLQINSIKNEGTTITLSFPNKTFTYLPSQISKNKGEKNCLI